MSHCQLVVEEFCRRVLAMVVDGDERGGGRVIKIRRAAGINALRKYKCTNSYGDMSLSQSLPNGRFEIPNGDKASFDVFATAYNIDCNCARNVA